MTFMSRTILIECSGDNCVPFKSELSGLKKKTNPQLLSSTFNTERLISDNIFYV